MWTYLFLSRGKNSLFTSSKLGKWVQVWQFSLCVFISTSSNVSWGRKPNPVKRVCLLFTKQNREKDLNSSFVRQLNQNATNWSNQTTIIMFCRLTENGTSIKCKAAFETCTVTREKTLDINWTFEKFS